VRTRAQVLHAATRQAHREATPTLNSASADHGRYGTLTALEPSTAPRATESRRRRERQAAWHAQRALEPTLDALFTREREVELINTRAEPTLRPLPLRD
jgi:hypothetical protein